MKTVFLILAIGFASFQLVQAQDERPSMDRYYLRAIQQTLIKTSQLPAECETCGLFKSPTGTNKSQECRDDYKKMYKVKDTLNAEQGQEPFVQMGLFFGYMDDSGEVFDNYARAAAVTQVTAPCSFGESACGFTRAEDEDERFWKQVQFKGPDGKIRQRTIVLTIASSSVSDSDAYNKREGKEQQTEQTRHLQALYADALTNSEVALYVGHARKGGGPDFNPPRMKGSGRDYAYYQKNKPGLTMMKNALEGAQGVNGSTPGILGIFACDADDHFRSSVRKAAPKSGLVMTSSTEVGFSASVAQAMSTLDSALAMRCKDEFSEAIQSSIDMNDVPAPDVRLENF